MSGEIKIMNIIKTTLVILMILCQRGFGQSDITTMKAVFMERFTRFIEWPKSTVESSNDTVFNILILGENPFGKSLELLFTTTPVKNKKVKISYSNNINAISKCQMVYVSKSKEKELNRIKEFTRKHPVLSISDNKNFGKSGIMINFFIEEEMLRFEVNLKEIKDSPLVVGSPLLKVAKIIE